MSHYRDDRDAARCRIDALEARLAEREAELGRRGVALAERDEEILRLQRELELAGGLGPRHARSVNAAWASRIVGAAVGLAVVAAGAGVVLVRSSTSASPPPAAIAMDDTRTAEAPPAPSPSPIHADPFVSGPLDWSLPAPELPAPIAPLRPPNEVQIRRQLESRVWGGRASRDETRLLKVICAQDGDLACRERARAELDRSRAEK